MKRAMLALLCYLIGCIFFLLGTIIMLMEEMKK
jgi:hypothetical protein